MKKKENEPKNKALLRLQQFTDARQPLLPGDTKGKKPPLLENEIKKKPFTKKK